MADLKGLFQNNRRREINAVVGTLPYTIEVADLREGTAAVVAGNEAYTLCTLPAGVLIKSVSLYVATGEEFDTGTCTVAIGATEVFAALTDLTTAGVAEFSTPFALEADADVIITPATLTGANGDRVRIVIDYIDYDRATMSYIGEN